MSAVARVAVRIGWTRRAVFAVGVTLVVAVGGQGRVPVPGASPAGEARSPLPTALVAVASSTVGAEWPEFAAVRRNGMLSARGGGLATKFDSTGLVVRAPSGRLSLRLGAVGRSGSLVRVGVAAPTASGNRVTYRRGSVEEWYLNGALGLEQGFTLSRRPAGAGSLTLAVRASGPLQPRRSGAEVVFAGADGTAVARYGGLFAVDAAGTTLPTRLELAGRTLLLRVDDAGALYPLTVDPFIQLGDKLTGGGETGSGQFGVSVALSADGSTALIGGYRDDGSKGAAWIFTRSGAGWSQQGGKLTGSGATGNAQFGGSVALSADGKTALVGGFLDAGGKGAGWVFTRSGAAWNQQGAKLTGNDESGNGLFGASVALSSDGSTALIGAFDDDSGKGAAFVFARSGTTWTQQGGKLTGGGETGAGSFGVSVALSSDGSTALIGAYYDDATKGAAFVFTKSGTTWTQQGGKLIGSGETGTAEFGTSVALSADGSTALIGGGADALAKGAAWVFRRSGTAWNQQGAKLTGTGESGNGQFGRSVALSADGSTALIGAYYDDATKGAAFVFTRSGTTWTQQGDKLTGMGQSGNGRFGGSVALSADGSTALIGAYYDDATKGAAWLFNSAPPTANPIVARIVDATVVGHGKERTLSVRIRINKPAKAQLTLLRRGVTRLRKTFPVKGGANGLKAPIATGITKGTYQLKILITDTSGNRKTSTISVPVPA